MQTKIFLLSVLISFSSLVSKAQSFLDEEKTPVKTKVSQLDNTDGSKTIKICFEVEEGWMVYDSLIGGEGPIPLTIEIEEKTNLKELKKIKPKLKKKHDEVFEIDIMYFNSDVCYQIIANPIAEGKPIKITISYQYMCCNLITGVCLPPVYKTTALVWNVK